MLGSIASKWNELDRTAKLSSTTGIILGTWGFPLFALVLAQAPSGIVGEGEYGIGVVFLALLPNSILLVASGLSLLLLNSTRMKRLSITILVLLGVNHSNIHDRWLCHPSSIPLLAPSSHRFLFLKETSHRENYRKPRQRAGLGI